MTNRITRSHGSTGRIPPWVENPVIKPPITPTITPNGGTITSTGTISIVSSGATAIYYTINGATPTASSTLYAGPFSLASSATVKAIAANSAGTLSSVASAIFTISGSGGGGSLGDGVYETTDLAPASAYIAQMFGGESDTKIIVGTATRSWANNPAPDNAQIDTVNGPSAIHDFLNDIYAAYVIGMSPPERFNPATGVQGWTQNTWPTFNQSAWTSKLVVVEDHLSVPLQRVEVRGSSDSTNNLKSRRMASWHMATNAQMWAGRRIPLNLQPTNDTDSTLWIYFPNWKWPGDLTKTSYFGRIDEYWGAWSPEQAATSPMVRAPDDPYLPGKPITGWSCKSGGSLIGAKTRIIARPVDRLPTGGDAANTSQDSFGASAAPWDPVLSTNPSKIYWGYGPDGVSEEKFRLASASHLPMSHLEITRRDVANGKIRHRIGLAMQVYYAGGPPTSAQGSKPNVWPSTQYDGSSRSYFRNGNCLRFAPGSTPIYPSAMPTEWRPFFDMCFYAVRDYGTMLVDTAYGGGWTWRCEPTLDQVLPNGILGRTFIKYLFQSAQDGLTTLQMFTPGSDTAFFS